MRVKKQNGLPQPLKARAAFQCQCLESRLLFTVPMVNTFQATPPSPITVGQVVSFSATAGDPDVGDSVTQVSFYEDANSNGIPEDAELISTDIDGSNGWGGEWDTKL